MDRVYACHRHCCEKGALWRDLCPQGYRVRVRLRNKRSFQTLPDRRVPTAERAGTGTTRLERETRTVQDKLPHPHRRDQAEPDPGGGYARPGECHLCQRSGRAERGDVRRDGWAMA